jgi:uncharacterized protein YdhG (YjbR/CyaY superfamily)
MTELKTYEYDALLHEDPESGGAYVIFPWDIRKEFGQGRVKVHAEFDGIPYEGSVVNMGVRNADGSVCYIIGVLKRIRNELHKNSGDTIHVVIRQRDSAKAEESARKWKCPKCGREFSRQNQDHYCVKPQNIDEYIAAQAAEIQPVLNELRDILRKALPEAQERISWSMPTYWKGKNIIHFAAAKKHIGLYPGDQAAVVFKDELAGFDVSKGTIRIPYNKPLPAQLITKIARWCFEEYAE